ncbi:MAG: hypothetical protein HY590_07360 [Candidatus Omnitrophica bacterium]|nr:hypothetical protein [Candidatus Omnitrophota bacterium]
MRNFLSFQSERGAMLIIMYMVIFILLVLAAAYLIRTTNEAKLSERARHASEAFYIAEGALQQILFDLRRDMANSSSWEDGSINGLAITPDDDNWQTVPYAATTMGDGTFQVELKEVEDKPTDMWVRATGVSGGITRRIQAYTGVENLSLWNNVIFAGTGQGGNAIGGNVDIRGSVHILGTALTSADVAMDMNGGGNIGNNYTGMNVTLAAKLPALVKQNFNGEMVDTLNAVIRFKNGKLRLQGAVTAGQSNVTGNTVKETLDGAYVTHGYTGNTGAAGVNSDNGTANVYDADDSVMFPNFSNAYTYDTTGISYGSYDAFVTAQGLSIPITKVDSSTDNFSYSNSVNGLPNSISWNKGSGTLTVTGIIYVNGSFEFGEKNKTVLYEGRATFVAVGASSDIKVHGDLLSKGTFPTMDVMGFVAQRNVELQTGTGDAQSNMTGIFYAENEIKAAKQNQMAGTFNSNHFDMQNTPSIFQVPEVVNNLPPGIIAEKPVFIMKIKSWQEVQ